MNEFDIEKNHKIYLERLALYKSLGLDQVQARENLIKEINPQVKNILEIGTGKGHLTIMLAQKFPMIYSVDIDKEEQRIALMNIEYAKVQDKVNLVLSDNSPLPFEKQSFDLVISAFTFHHLVEPFKVIKEMIDLAKDQIIISDFNKNGFAVVEKIHSADGGKHHHENKGYFEIVGTYLEEYGFVVKKVSDNWQDVYIANRKKS